VRPLLPAVLLLLAACKEEPPSTAPVTSGPAATPSAAPEPTRSAATPPREEPTSVAAQHVLVAYKGAKDVKKGVTRTKDEAQKRAAEVVTKARGGADFSALVKEYSDDPAAGERQGSVGKFTRDKMAKPFSDAAFALPVALPVDGISDVVETPFGFHVIKRNQLTSFAAGAA
jgi:peptidyl-prolyl cis-trans isomerase NIMA-interacting 1